MKHIQILFRTARVVTAGGALMLAASLTSGCRNKHTSVEGATQKPSVNPSASVPKRSLVPPPAAERTWKAPSGITLPIFAGEGIGPIRFGATIATVERLMAIPCQEKTPTFCRMSDRGVNFYFNEDGALEKIFVARTDRKDEADPKIEFGMFNGVIAPRRASLGMVPEAIEELVGPPKKTEKLGDPASVNNTRLRQTYDSLVLDYDLMENGKLVLSGITVLPKPGMKIPRPRIAPTPSAAAAPSAAATPSAEPMH